MLPDGGTSNGPMPDRLRPLSPGSILTNPRNAYQRYTITAARQLPRSTYYDALDLTCPTCRQLHTTLPPRGVCEQCQSALQPVLIHERRGHSNGPTPPDDVAALIHISQGHPNILPHQAFIQFAESRYTVVEHPRRWGVLVRGRRRRSADEALAGAIQVGQALTYLQAHGFIYAEVGGSSIESLIVVSGPEDIKLADLSACVRTDPNSVLPHVEKEIAFLGWLLFYLAVGKEPSRAELTEAPPSLRPFVERAIRREYAGVPDMLTDLSTLPSLPSTAPRSLKPSHGQATHTGQRRRRNEDAVVTFTFDKEQDGRSVPIGFYLVADGMGGYEAGDVASRTVNQIVTDWILKTRVLPDLRKATRKLTTGDLPADLLTQAIEQANEALIHRRQATGKELGSTVTAALVIGDVVTIANVGDSRAYLLRDGRLEQITQDHSLVARLVDAGVIEPEEVRQHPRRNEIYRSLGHKPHLEVDTFTRQLRAGDRLILCSDGLWEMVTDAEIQAIVEAGHTDAGACSPQQACDALVEAANRAGGEDNISVIVVAME